MSNVNNETEKVFWCSFGGSRSVSKASGVKQMKKAMEYILRDNPIVQWPPACAHISPSSVRVYDHPNTEVVQSIHGLLSYRLEDWVGFSRPHFQ
ncbi:hypothetical protein EG68_11106 [Paragonimus skrjabini miyazakii]|uniref:Uncharacterized protein n=1 Tax=Paragonimus skrjabini miyazakii TaxID=59628 RepID=A0A8S9YEC7_9TREM|nr:hypothetical protein EG68_11106 [Paragonimus skrjabini miyazakii]